MHNHSSEREEMAIINIKSGKIRLPILLQIKKMHPFNPMKETGQIGVRIVDFFPNRLVKNSANS